MGAFDKCNAAGWRDDAELPLSEQELVEALDMRQAHGGYTATRHDQCPHPQPCSSLADCVEKIAWYRRHQVAIERRIAVGAVDGYVPPN